METTHGLFLQTKNKVILINSNYRIHKLDDGRNQYQILP